MASRFEIVEVEPIEILKDKSENENTKNSTEYSVLEEHFHKVDA